jgi:3-deoxy-manno-octulosonate cytidylyltransferase (CMP-KDO synthetase)
MRLVFITKLSTEDEPSRWRDPSTSKNGRVLLFVVRPASTGFKVDSVPPLDIVAVIPARFASTRFPGKPLADIDGRPMIEHVYRRAAASPLVSRVIVATDDLRIATTVSDFGGKVRLTKATHETGTDRLAEVAATLDCDVVVNVQGDEPLIDPRAIGELVAPFVSDPGVQMTTLFRRIHDVADLNNPNIAKVVIDRGGYAMYFSRAPIPHRRDPRGGWPPLYRHIGLYGYRRSALMVLATLEPTPLERAESLEQLRALEHGIRIKAVETQYESFEVNTPEDLEQVRRLLTTTSSN